MDQLQEDFLSSEAELTIDNEASGYLIETSGWAKFIAITFFSIVGLIILFFVFYSNDLIKSYTGRYENPDDFKTAFIVGLVVALVVITAVVGVMYYFLLAFANYTRKGLATENINTVNNGLKALKVHFIIVAIVSMISILISIYNLF
ncbi:hypothetical protein [Ferruginibacter sp. SUN106]|uniref:hypothetical protein n=1 Tax=Ferruginibacter sp. SUN106 TaxID=2978348 RepID=UPI003D368440